MEEDGLATFLAGITSKTVKSFFEDLGHDVAMAQNKRRRLNPSRKKGRPKPNGPLETLPAEIRRHLLATMRIDEQRLLTTASNFFFEQYKADRRYVTLGSLEATLGDLVIEAYAVQISGHRQFQAIRTQDTVLRLIGDYKTQRACANHSKMLKTIPDEDADGMIRFYDLAQLLIKKFILECSNRLNSEPEGGIIRGPLSRTEEIRLMRAMYRFQLCCNLFGVGYHDMQQPDCVGFSSVDLLRLFFSLFEAWEIEEICCIYTFAKDRYETIFDRIHEDVDEDNPKFGDWDRDQEPPEGSFPLNDIEERTSILSGTVSRGLIPLEKVFYPARSHEWLVSTMQGLMSWPFTEFLENEALGEVAQAELRRIAPSVRDTMSRAKVRQPFKDDNVVKKQPPIAWTWMWDGTYSNLFGQYIPDNIRRWGYVIWDADRLERIGAEAVLKRQWFEKWEGRDPREHIVYHRGGTM